MDENTALHNHARKKKTEMCEETCPPTSLRDRAPEEEEEEPKATGYVSN